MTALAISKAIDPARVGISKSLMTTPCERKGFLSETVRDKKGRRLSFPMPERVLFGAAVDEAIGYIAFHEKRQTEWTREEAHRIGVHRAREMEASEPIDWETFDLQVSNAVVQFVEHGFGKDRIVRPGPLAWLREHIAEPGFLIQGNDGETLRADDVIGTPDFMCCSVIDVKTTGARYNESKFVRSAEMPVYAHLYTEFHEGTLPRSLIYLAYIRVTKPYWDVFEVPASSNHVALGRIHAAHWRAALESGNPDLFSFDSAFCGECPFAQPIPEVGFTGCSVGLLMPREEVAA